jgi:hypothetical protein
MKARKPEVHTAIGRVTFHFRPSAIDGRFDIEFETGAPTYVRFGAVLTRRTFARSYIPVVNTSREASQSRRDHFILSIKLGASQILCVKDGNSTIEQNIPNPPDMPRHG